MRIKEKSCSHSIERELSMRAEEKWQMALRPGAQVIKGTVETAETDMVSRGIVCVGEDTLVFRNVDFEMMAEYPSEMIQHLADGKRMKLSK